MLFDKYKNSRFVDYTECCWGHSFIIDDRKECRAHGFYSQYIKDGNLVYHKSKDRKSIWLARVYDVYNCLDPSDMFFCRYKTIKFDRQLIKRERKVLEEIMEND